MLILSLDPDTHDMLIKMLFMCLCSMETSFSSVLFFTRSVTVLLQMQTKTLTADLQNITSRFVQSLCVSLMSISNEYKLLHAALLFSFFYVSKHFFKIDYMIIKQDTYTLFADLLPNFCVCTESAPERIK